MKRKEYTLAELGVSEQKVSPASMDVVKRLQSKGYQAYLVGGAVRDLLLDLNPKDYDVVTDARPEQIKKLFKRAWIIGRRFKLVHVRDRKEIVEVSTFRKTPEEASNAQSGKPIEDNTYGNATEDAYRRDLTVNSLMLDPVRQIVIDHTGGIEDIKKRTLRVIGDPRKRYLEDPVRMLRLLRLSAKLDCKIASRTLQPVKSLSSKLAMVPEARLMDECTKFIFSKSASKAFEMSRQQGIFELLFPHTRDYSKEQFKFIDAALHQTDQFMRKNEHCSLSFVFSTFFWPSVSQPWNEACSKGSANMNLMLKLYNASGVNDSPLLPKNIRGKIWQIWEFQSRFFRLQGKKKSLSIDPRKYASKKALDFLRFRTECGEIEPTLADWWEDFAELDFEDRKALVGSSSRSNKRNDRKQKRSRA